MKVATRHGRLSPNRVGARFVFHALWPVVCRDDWLVKSPRRHQLDTNVMGDRLELVISSQWEDNKGIAAFLLWVSLCPASLIIAITAAWVGALHRSRLERLVSDQPYIRERVAGIHPIRALSL